MDGWQILLELIASLAAAFFVGALFERLKLGAVVGYILAGILVGPSTFGVVQSLDTVRGLAELGIALMLFTTGLEFSILRLRKLGRSTLLAGVSQLVICLLLFAGIATACGVGWRSAITIGAIVAVSSTAIVLRVLRERGDMDSSYGKTSFGILLLQDVALVPLVLMVTLLAGRIDLSSGLENILTAVGGFIAAAVVFVVVVTRFLPRVLRSRVMTTNRELPILLGIITCTGASWAAHAIGISPSLGAFIAGVLLAETSFEEQIRSDLAGLKAVFGTLFFASVGMLVDVHWIVKNWIWVLVATAVILVGKSLGNFVAIRMWKRTTKSSCAAAITLSQVGELGFILLQIGTVSGLLAADQGQLLTAAAVLTMVLSPLLINNATKIAYALAARLLPAPRIDEEEREEQRSHMTHHFVVVGFGTSGKTVARILCEAQYTVVAVDIDPKFIKQAKEMDVVALVGDATQVDLLSDLCLNDARALIVALPDHRSSALTIAHARRLAPDLVIVARARYHQFQDELREAGATHVIGEEELLGRRLGEEAVRLAIGEEDEDVREAI